MPPSRLVSLIVRTKDRPKLLKRALKSIAAQEYRHIEAILVNDGGCELDVEELKGILGDIHLNYIRLEKNTGRSHAGNVGIENAKGAYIGFLDDDDEYHPEHVMTLVSFLEKSDYNVAYTDSLMVYKEYDPKSHDLDKDVKKEVAFSYDFNFDRLVFENYIPFMCLLFDRRALAASRGFDTSFDLYEDWDLLIRVGKKYPFYHIRQVTANYNQWSTDFQISQANKDPLFLRQAYLNILSRHIDKVTPHRIHDYMSEFVYTRHLLKDLRKEHEVYRGVLSERESVIDKLNAELRERVNQTEALVRDMKGKEARTEELSIALTESASESERLLDELKQRDEKIDKISDEIKKRDFQIDVLDSSLKDRDSQIGKLFAELKEKDPRVERLYNELRERDARIDAYAAELGKRDSRIDALIFELEGKDSRMSGLTSELRERDSRIDSLAGESRERDSQLVKLYAEVRERDSQLVRLYAELRERDAQLVKLYADLKERDARMDSLSEELKERHNQIDVLVAGIREKDSRLDVLNSELLGKDAGMVILQNTIRERDVLITAMKNTRGWRMLEKFRRIRDRIFVPLSGKSERDQRAVEKAVESRTAEAPAYIGEKAGGFRSGNRKIITLNNVVHDPILSMVSVVIPTKNAGEEFEYALRRIKQQEGIQEIEIVIVDSGSTDRTIDLASRYSEKVLRVAPEDFHHARTRNLGAERAAGDFVVFTVQDAVPVSNYWLYRLVSPLYKGEASAVSARQIPRSDADLFASWAMWVHNHYLGYDHDRMISRSIFRNFDSLDLQEKRSAAGLDSVCLGIKKSVFDQYLFRSGYGEDLDLGVRLLKDNHTMLFQFSNGVIHSHNRPALYYLKRGYIDTIYLWKILDIERKNIPSRPVLEAISYLYGLLKACLFTLKVEYEFNKEPVSLIHSFLNNFEGRLATSSSRGDSGNNVGEPQLDSFFEQFLPNSHQHISSEIYSAMRGSLLSFSDFMKSFTSVDGMKEDFLRSIYKIFSNTAGYYLGANTRDAIDALEGSI